MHPEVGVDGLGAVVAGAHSDPGSIEHLADVMRVDAIDDEGHHAEPVAGIGRPEHAHAGHARQAVQKTPSQHLFTGVQTVQAQP